MNRIVLIRWLLFYWTTMAVRTEAGYIRCSEANPNASSTCISSCSYRGPSTMVENLPDCDDVQQLSNLGQCTSPATTYMSCANCPSAGTYLCDQNSCQQTNRNMSNDQEYYYCEINCNVPGTVTPGGCSNCAQTLVNRRRVYYCTNPEDRINISSWQYFDRQFSYGATQQNTSDLWECLNICEYSSNCIAIDFDRRPTIPACWIHTDPTDLTSVNIYSDDNVTQYQINRTNLEREEDCKLQWTVLLNMHSVGSEQRDYYTLYNCFTFCQYSTNCVAIDFASSDSPPCWVYTNAADLTEVYEPETGIVNQYRMNRTCPAPDTEEKTIGRCVGQSFPTDFWCFGEETIHVVKASYKAHPLCCYRLGDSADVPDNPSLPEVNILQTDNASYLGKIQACEGKSMCNVSSEVYRSDAFDNIYCRNQLHETNYVTLTYRCVKPGTSGVTMSTSSQQTNTGATIPTQTVTMQSLTTGRTTGMNIESSGQWMTPNNCMDNCSYKISWVLNQITDVIQFTIVARQSSNVWTAIGIARGRSMENVDVVYGFVGSDGQGVVIDGWIGSRYTQPTKDVVQNLQNYNITYQNGFLILTFSRNRFSSDSQDYSFSNTDCYYFFFPVGGGIAISDDGQINKHFNTPIISDNMICIRSSSMGTLN